MMLMACNDSLPPTLEREVALLMRKLTITLPIFPPDANLPIRKLEDRKCKTR